VLGLKKTRIVGLSGRERSLTISSAVWIQYSNVTDGRTDRRIPGDSKDRDYAKRRVVKTNRCNPHSPIFSHVTLTLDLLDSKS